MVPGLSQLSDGLENAITTMATAIVQQTDEARTSRETKLLEEQTPKLPSAVDKFKHTLHLLLRLLETDDEDTLPTLWHEWANCGKKQELGIFKDLLENYAQSRERFIAKAPIVTPKLVQDIIAFNFIGDHRDDVTTGISPFNAIDGGEGHRRHNLALSKLQGTIYNNEVSFTLNDLDTLQKRELRAVPLCYFDLEKSLGLFGNLLGVVLGNTHALTTAYRQFWDMLTSTARDDIRDIVDVQHTIRPAHIIRSVQLITHTRFTTRKANGMPPAPSFVDIILRIQMASYQLPQLTGVYHDLTYSVKTTATPTTSVSSGAYSSDLSTISGSLPLGQVMTGPVQSARPTQGPTRNEFVRNMAPDGTLQALIPPNLQLRSVIKNDLCLSMILIYPCACPSTCVAGVGLSVSGLMTIIVAYHPVKNCGYQLLCERNWQNCPPPAHLPPRQRSQPLFPRQGPDQDRLSKGPCQGRPRRPVRPWLQGGQPLLVADGKARELSRDN
jgi:hypothetical protein